MVLPCVERYGRWCCSSHRWLLDWVSTLPDDAAGGREALLVLDDGVWTSERWSMLEEQGVQPLRSVRSDALLVWMNAADNAQRWGPGISVEVPEPAELRLGLDSSGGPETTEFSSNLASRTAVWKRSNPD